MEKEAWNQKIWTVGAWVFLFDLTFWILRGTFTRSNGWESW